MLSSQGYGFSSSHVWMWELDYKESWAPKNWCFWTVVLEKTLESPSDCKEIQPVCSKGDQYWVFIGRTNVEAETPILWPPKPMSIELGMPSSHLILCRPLLLWPSIFPSIWVFLTSQFFTSGGQSTRASASVLPMNIQDWFPLEVIYLILQSKGLSRVVSNTMVQKHQFFGTQPSLWSSSHIHTRLLEKP